MQILGQGTHRADCAEARGDSTVADIGQVCEMPVVVQRQVPTALIVQKFVEMPLLQALHNAVDVAVVVPRQVTTVPVRSESCGDSTFAVHRQGRGHPCC